MMTRHFGSNCNSRPATSLLAILIVGVLAASNLAVRAQEPKPSPQPPEVAPATAQEVQAPQDAKETPKIPNDQLDSLVAPIALYPDPLLSQVLVASTYPLELVQLQQWLHMSGQYMNEKAKAEAVQKQDWDPSIQAMVVLPDVVKRLAENIKWTSDLGNAFLAQQSDVMDAVQRMRTKAKDAGKLASNEQMKVETQQVESKTVVVIQQSNPEVIYVPSYNPAIIWGTVGYYPYPPIYYAPYAGLYAYGVGIGVGIAWGGGWGWGAGWGHNNININVNNRFVNHYNVNRGNRVNNINSGNRTWQHNPQHRGGAPYANRDIANRFGGAARGDSVSNRQANARQNIGRQAGTMDRSGFGGGNRASQGGGGQDIGRSLANRPSQGGGSGGFGGNRASTGGGSMGGDRIGSRDISRGAGASQRGTGSWGGGGGSWGSGAARASSSRGSSSMGGGGWGGRGGGGGGGFSRGGGGRGGGGRR